MYHKVIGSEYGRKRYPMEIVGLWWKFVRLYMKQPMNGELTSVNFLDKLNFAFQKATQKVTY